MTILENLIKELLSELKGNEKGDDSFGFVESPANFQFVFPGGSGYRLASKGGVEEAPTNALRGILTSVDLKQVTYEETNGNSQIVWKLDTTLVAGDRQFVIRSSVYGDEGYINNFAKTLLVSLRTVNFSQPLTIVSNVLASGTRKISFAAVFQGDREMPCPTPKTININVEEEVNSLRSRLNLNSAPASPYPSSKAAVAKKSTTKHSKVQDHRGQNAVTKRLRSDEVFGIDTKDIIDWLSPQNCQMPSELSPQNFVEFVEWMAVSWAASQLLNEKTVGELSAEFRQYYLSCPEDWSIEGRAMKWKDSIVMRLNAKVANLKGSLDLDEVVKDDVSDF